MLDIANPKDKALGAYYTDESVARFLVRWALQKPGDRIADPAFGGGVFLEAALERLQKLGGKPSQVFGVELDPKVHAEVARALPIPKKNLILSDFFQVSGTAAMRDAHPLAAQLPPLEAIVGNPPFIRYQRFSGEGRKLAMEAAAAQGVSLNQLASSWAAFVVHATGFLVEGGRLGMVIPSELGHATYAREVMAFLSRSYARVTLLTFRQALFPDLSQDCLLLLAEGKGLGSAQVELIDLEDASVLASPLPTQTAVPVDAEAIAEGRGRLNEYWLPKPTRELYHALRSSPNTFRLGQIAKVGIGYVSGHNNFFHPPSQQLSDPTYLKPAVRRGKGLKGLRYSQTDWEDGLLSQDSGYLLHVPPKHPELSDELLEYIAKGEAEGIHQGYKCRIRTPWYAVPHVYTPDAFLTYMSGEVPKLVANTAQVVAPNTLHLVRLREDSAVDALTLAALWQTSLARLSGELEGHAMGGGMLKIEPREAEAAILPKPVAAVNGLIKELDKLLRVGKGAQAQELADETLLSPILSKQEIAALRDGARQLMNRRYRR